MGKVRLKCGCVGDDSKDGPFWHRSDLCSTRDTCLISNNKQVN